MTGPLRRLRWCFSTLGCPELTLPEVCALAREFGFHGLELRALCDSVDLPQVFLHNRWNEVASGLWRQNGLRPVVAGSSFKLTGIDAAERMALLSYASWAESLGIPFVRVFGGGTWGTSLKDADYEAAVGNLEWWGAERQSRGWSIEMLVETHDAFSVSGPCLELQRRSASPVQWIWDSHHTWRLGKESPDETWSKLGPFIRHVHIKDSIDVSSKRHPYTYVLPGEGQMPMDKVAAVLRAHAFAGFVSLEWEKMWHPYLPPLRTALSALHRLAWFNSQREVTEPICAADLRSATPLVTEPAGGAS